MYRFLIFAPLLTLHNDGTGAVRKRIGIFAKIQTMRLFLSGRSKIEKTKILLTKINCNLMKVKSVAECSPWSILQYF